MTAHLLLTLVSAAAGHWEQMNSQTVLDTGIHWVTLGYTGSSSQTVLDGSPVHQHINGVGWFTSSPVHQHINGVGWFTREAAIVQGGQQQRPPDGLRRINSFDTI